MKYKDFEAFLQDKHAEQYMGFDDEMPDDFVHWMADLTLDDLISLGSEYGKISYLDGSNDCHKALKEEGKI